MCAEECEARWGNTAEMRETDGEKGRRERNKKKEEEGGGGGTERGDSEMLIQQNTETPLQQQTCVWCAHCVLTVQVSNESNSPEKGEGVLQRVRPLGASCSQLDGSLF